MLKIFFFLILEIFYFDSFVYILLLLIYFLLDDEIVGASVSIRAQDDILQIWNNNSSAVKQSRVIHAYKDMLHTHTQ